VAFELDPLVLLGIAVWLSVVGITLASIWLSARRLRRRIDAIEGKAWTKVDEMASRYEAKLTSMMDEARPFLGRLDVALTSVGNLEAFPATVVVGMKPVLHEFMEAEVKPLAQSFMNGVTVQLNEALQKVETLGNKMMPLLAVGNKLFASEGGNAKAEKVRNKEVADNIRARIPSGIMSLLPKRVKLTDDPGEIIDIVKSFAPLAQRFGFDIDGLISQFLGAPGGEGGVMPILGMPGLSTQAKPAVEGAGADYMKE